MRARIWDDKTAMSIVSVLGFLMNDDGEVVGMERTKVLVKLMPSIVTLTHRAMIAMLIYGLNDDDTKTFYAEQGLLVLNQWLLEGVKLVQDPKHSKEKKRVEMYSQVRALLRILETCVMNDDARRQNKFLCEVLKKLVSFLDNSGPDFAPEYSRLNIHRRYFEHACGVTDSSLASDAKSNSTSHDSSNTSTSTSNNNNNKSTPSKVVLKPAAKATSSSSAATISATSSVSSSSADAKVTSSSSNSTLHTSNHSTPHKATSVLAYQPRSFLSKATADAKASDSNAEAMELDEDDNLQYARATGAQAASSQSLTAIDMGEEEGEEDEDDEEEPVITNLYQKPKFTPGLDAKIRKFGHNMEYAARDHCLFCRRMMAKRCARCGCCVKCAQRETCDLFVARGIKETAGKQNVLSSSEKTAQVLGSAMDQAIFRAFRSQDFYAVFSLVNNGADINFQRVESDMSTALMAAALHGRDDAATKLLEMGADPTILDVHGEMACSFAKRKGHMKLAEKLQHAAENWTGAPPPPSAGSAKKPSTGTPTTSPQKASTNQQDQDVDMDNDQPKDAVETAKENQNQEKEPQDAETEDRDENKPPAQQTPTRTSSESKQSTTSSTKPETAESTTTASNQSSTTSATPSSAGSSSLATTAKDAENQEAQATTNANTLASTSVEADGA